VAAQREERPSRLAKRSRRFAAECGALAEQVRSLRLARGWTLEHASGQTSVDVRHLQKIEAGEVNVTLATLVRLAEAFGVAVSELFAPIDTATKE
jgi:transcriptional regulator with XRE-family HTH domain